MRRWKIYTAAILSVFILVGCSKAKTSTTEGKTSGTSANTSNTNNANKDKINKANDEYKSKLDQIKLDYKNKRSAAEQERTNNYSDKISSEDQDRDSYFNSRITYITAELQKRNEEQLGLINTQYTKGVEKINGSSLAEQDKTKELNDAYETKSQGEVNQTMVYENRKVQLERIKRTYSANIQTAKDNRDKNEVNFKKSTVQKYDDEFDKLTSIHVGEGSDWEVLLQKEQRELSEYYTSQDKQYNDYVKAMNVWLNDSINGLLF